MLPFRSTSIQTSGAFSISQRFRTFHRQCSVPIAEAFWAAFVEPRMRYRFGRKVRRLFLVLVIFATLSPIWYSMYSTSHLLKVKPYGVGARGMASTVKAFPNVSAMSERERQELEAKAHPTLHRIRRFFAKWSYSIQDTFALLWWTLFKKQDLRNVPQTMNFTEDVTEDTVFIYRAFLDIRRPQQPLIRVLAFSQCRDIAITLHYGSICISAQDVTVEYDCPWKWVPQCKWFSFVLIFNLQGTNFTETTKKIFLSEGSRKAIVALHQLPKDRQDTLQVCVPPLYWYWNYAAFIQFIEIWRRQGATLFYIYYISVNRQMMDILKIYEKMGIIRLIRWQMMPRSETVDPNRWIYRFGHTLSFNDCLYRATAKYAALVDIDEFIIPSSGTLLPFLREMHVRNNTAGSFVFEHARVRFQGYNDFKLKTRLDFSWLKNAEYQIREGPSKTVFMPERVQILTTHKVREFLKPHRSYKIDTEEGLLYHARSNWIFTTLNNFTFYPADIFEEYIAPLNKQYQQLMSQVLWPEQNLVQVWKLLARKIEKCLSEWRWYGCKAPYHLCWNVLHDQDEWIFSHTNVSSDYILL